MDFAAFVMFCWAILALLSCAGAAPLHTVTPGSSNCDGVNCWISLTSGHSAHDWTPQQLAAAKPAELLRVELDFDLNLDPNLIARRRHRSTPALVWAHRATASCHGQELLLLPCHSRLRNMLGLFYHRQYHIDGRALLHGHSWHLEP